MFGGVVTQIIFILQAEKGEYAETLSSVKNINLARQSKALNEKFIYFIYLFRRGLQGYHTCKKANKNITRELQRNSTLCNLQKAFTSKKASKTRQRHVNHIFIVANK